MTKFQRIRSFFSGLLTIIICIIMITDPEFGISFAVLILGLKLSTTGLKNLFFYFSMAQYMVGGRAMLYQGLIILDFGLFTLAIVDSMSVYVLLYLLGSHIFAGAIDIMRGVESAKMKSPSWKLNTSQAAVNIIMALLCIIFFRSQELILDIYCAGLAYTALVKIITAFRKTDIVYIR